MSAHHKSTERDYLARVNDEDYPKAKAAEIAKKFSFDYWDGDRRICYGGYRYIEGKWVEIAKSMSDFYNLPNNAKILDIGCGKGYLLYDFLKIIPNAKVYGIDISEYAISNSKPEIKDVLIQGNMLMNLPYDDNFFDLVISINTLHTLHTYDLEKSLIEMERVGKNNKYLCVKVIEMSLRKLIYYIGKLLVKHLIPLLNGNGGLIKQAIMAIIHLFILNNFIKKCYPKSTKAAILIKAK